MKAIARHTVCDQWLQDFHADTKHLGDVLLGLDNWGPQTTPMWQGLPKKYRIKLTYSPEDTTDLCAVTDAGLGREERTNDRRAQGDTSVFTAINLFKIGAFAPAV